MIKSKEDTPIDQTYRFWVRINSQPVRLSLTVDQYLTIHRGGPDDEGYHYAEDVYYIDRERGVLIFETSYESRDCDGRMSGGCEYWAYLDELAVKRPYRHAEDETRLTRMEDVARPVRFVNFRELDASFYRRDHQAEAAGF